MSLEVPGQIRVNVQCIPGPNALPASLNNQGPGTLDIIQFGGMTKLEYVTTQLVAAAVAAKSLPYGFGLDESLRHTISLLVNAAKITLELSAMSPPGRDGGQEPCATKD